MLVVPLVGVVVVSPRLDAFVAMQGVGSLTTLALMMLAEGFHRSAYTILAVVAAALGFAGGLVFVRFFERELDP